MITAPATAADPAASRPELPFRETGEIAGAEYLIEIPEGWNGGLIMYAHGYEAVAPRRAAFNRRIVEAAAPLGFAVAQSKYTVQGWAAREGIHDTEALRRYFWGRFGRTRPTIIAGDSQGGAITFRTIELYPEIYDGALPMCAVAEPALRFFKERVFDMRLQFDYTFPGLPGSVLEFPDGERTLANYALRITQMIREKPEEAEAFARRFDLPNTQQIAPVIAFWSEILREMIERTGGNAFDNRNTIYAGTEDDAKLNREIPRYAADPQAVEYLRQWVTPTGQISDPVIHLHTFIDQLIPADRVTYYEQLTQTAGTGEHFVQYYVDRFGHCNFKVEEVREALARLIAWINEGRRPEPGDLTWEAEREGE
jgi:pimeloyl-ACP methyl ester carboxylesterase